MTRAIERQLFNVHSYTTLNTIVKTFTALKAEITFTVKTDGKELKIV